MELRLDKDLAARAAVLGGIRAEDLVRENGAI
jgi:hypothetical protein